MRLSLHKILVLAILLSICSVIAIMLSFMLWSFDREFKAHVIEDEQRKDQFIIESLLHDYEISGDWSFLEDNPLYWQQLSSVRLRKPPPKHRYDHRPPHRQGHDSKHRPRRPISNAERFLLDKNKQLIIGATELPDEYSLTPIQQGQETIAFLGRGNIKKIFNPRQEKFIKQLKKLFALIAVSAVLVAVIIAWLLSRYLIKPIRHISNATNRLAAGDYSSRIEIKMKDELGELAQNFNLLANTLQKNEQSRKQWIADLSHELRTPLSILRGEIEALLDGVRKLDEERLQSLHREVMNLNKLINDLHELSMSDIGALNYEMLNQDIISILHETIEIVDTIAIEKNISLEKNEISDKAIKVLCDAHRLQQLFTNILMNSLAYTSSPGTLRVKTRSDENNIIIDFQDSAPGVSEEELPHLFDRLYRADSSRNRKTGGSGLGLSICQNIVEAHSGSINAKASPLGGLWISISLPKQQG